MIMNNQAATAMLGVMGGALKTCIVCERGIRIARRFTYPGLNASSAGKPRVSTKPEIDLGCSTATLAEGGSGEELERLACATYLMPQTIKDCPRRQSPAAKTPSTFVEYFCKGLSKCSKSLQTLYLGRRLDVRASVLLDT